MTQQAAGRVLVLDRGSKHLRRATRSLRSVVPHVEVTPSLGDTVPASFGVLLADYDTLGAEERDRLVRIVSSAPATRLLMLSESAARESFADLFTNRLLTNLVARNDDVDAWELIVTVQKLLRRDVFGMEKYFSWGVEPRGLKVTKAAEKGQVLGAAEEYAGAIGIDPRLTALYCNVADEFFTNAVFNAPVDAQGKGRYRELEREAQVELAPHEAIDVRFACDGMRLGISVSDPFGSLTQEHLQFYLGKCFRKGEDQVDTKAGGAGLGLYYVFECLSQFVVNIAPGQRTEMIGLIDVRGTYKDFAARNKSFNIFLA